MLQIDCLDSQCTNCDYNNSIIFSNSNHFNSNWTDMENIEFNCQGTDNYVVADIACPQQTGNNISLHIALNVPMDNPFDVDFGSIMLVYCLLFVLFCFVFFIVILLLKSRYQYRITSAHYNPKFGHKIGIQQNTKNTQKENRNTQCLFL